VGAICIGYIDIEMKHMLMVDANLKILNFPSKYIDLHESLNSTEFNLQSFYIKKVSHIFKGITYSLRIKINAILRLDTQTNAWREITKIP